MTCQGYVYVCVPHFLLNGTPMASLKRILERKHEGGDRANPMIGG